MYQFTIYEKATGEIRRFVTVSPLSELEHQIADDEGVMIGHLVGYRLVTDDVPAPPKAPPEGPIFVIEARR